MEQALKSRIGGVFYDLIVTWGWGMYGDSSSLYADPPQNVDLFVDQLFVIDGQKPERASREDRKFLRALVEDWIFDPAGCGAASGLPLTERRTPSS